VIAYRSWTARETSASLRPILLTGTTYESSDGLPATPGERQDSRRQSPVAQNEGLVFRGVSKSFDTKAGESTVLSGFDLTVERGQFVTLIGPSGCGKSTLLRLAAGLMEADAGEVSVFGQDVKSACETKQIGFVSQSPALLPWRSVLDNVRLPLQVNRKGGSRSFPLRSPEEILQVVGLGEALQKRPAQLSGGMQQRVSIARAFAFEPSLLLMDEPFAALDEFTREVLRLELLRLWSARNMTVVFVTHSVAEAVMLSDLVVVLSSAPARTVATIPITLSRPRDESVDLTEEFGEFERRIRAELRRGWQHGQ
jgi:NitT/TauT family transport system ATP-binding protein